MILAMLKVLEIPAMRKALEIPAMGKVLDRTEAIAVINLVNHQQVDFCPRIK